MRIVIFLLGVDRNRYGSDDDMRAVGTYTALGIYSCSAAACGTTGTVVYCITVIPVPVVVSASIACNV
jgi:hypothetical protein